jgi:PKD repeat protein
MRLSVRWFVCVLVAMVVTLMAAGEAVAATPPELTIALKAKHGYSLDVGDFTCARKQSNLVISYFKGKARASLSHSYIGPKSQCAATKNLASASLSAKWAGLVNIKLKLHAKGKAKRTKLNQKGCTGKGPLVQHAVATGTLDIAINPSGLGRVKLHKVAAQLLEPGKVHCKSPGGGKGSITGISLSAEFGTTFLTASQPAHGTRDLFLTTTGKSLPGKVTGTTSVDLSAGSSLFNVRSNLSSATIHGIAPLVTGSLAFHSDPACPGSPNGRTGTFTGTLVLHDDVGGKQTLKGARASGGTLSKNGGSTGTCGGGGGGPTPPSASFTDQQDPSATGNPELFAFTDQSFSTATIKSYAWNFGDPASRANNTSTAKNPTHTFSGFGTYTVSETVKDSKGRSNTTSQAVPVSDYPSPTANFVDEEDCDVDMHCLLGMNATFTVDFDDNSGQSSDGEPIVQEVWTFGDGSPSVTQTGAQIGNGLSHAYVANPTPGTPYAVTLTVTDAFGKVGVSAGSVYIDP